MNISTTTAAPGTSLDVRPVEPKHRFDRIMSTYDALAAGSTMELIVDHDGSWEVYAKPIVERTTPPVLASNQNNTAQVNGSGFTAIDQDNAVVSFTHLW